MFKVATRMNTGKAKDHRQKSTAFLKYGRGDWIRTSGLYVPNVTLTNRVRVCRATFTQFRKILFGTARFIIPNHPGLSIPFAEKLQKEAEIVRLAGGEKAGSRDWRKFTLDGPGRIV